MSAILQALFWGLFILTAGRTLLIRDIHESDGRVDDLEALTSRQYNRARDGVKFGKN